MSRIPRATVVGGFVVTVTALAFAPSLTAGFVSDDWVLIVRDAFVHDLDGLGRAFTAGFWDVSNAGAPDNPVYAAIYRPLVKALFVLEHHAFGEVPSGYHLVGLALHLVCVGLAFFWLRSREIGGRGGLAPEVAAAVGALIFALHPTRPESVTWISGVPDVLMTLFALLGLTLARGPRSSARAGLVGLCFGCAVLAKEPAVVLPVLVALDAVLLTDGEAPRASLRSRAPFIVAGAVGVAAAFSLRFAFVSSAPPPTGPIADAAARVVATFGHYALSTIWPVAPSIHPAIRQHDASFSPVSDPIALIVGATVIGSALVLAVLARRRRELRPWLADLLFFVVPLLPVANLVSLGHYSLISERFLYLPHLGVAALVARALVPAFGGGSLRRNAALGVVAVTLLGLSAVTIERQAHFRSDEALWEYERARNPDNAIAARELASIARAQGRDDDALSLLLSAHREASRARDERLARDLVLEVARQLVTAVSDSNREAQADLVDFYRAVIDRRPAVLSVAGETLRLAPSSELAGDALRVRLPYATALLRSGDVDAAVALLEALAREQPRAASVHNVLALARARRFEWARAQAALGRAEASMGEATRTAAIRGAIARARAALEVAGDDPLSRALAESTAQLHLGAPDAARQALAPQLARTPAPVAAVMAQVRIDVGEGELGRAREVLEDALARDPTQADLRRALAELDRIEGN